MTTPKWTVNKRMFEMLKQILNLLPASVVEEIGNASFKSLADRGEVFSWSVAYEPEASIAQKDRQA